MASFRYPQASPIPVQNPPYLYVDVPGQYPTLSGVGRFSLLLDSKKESKSASITYCRGERDTSPLSLLRRSNLLAE